MADILTEGSLHNAMVLHAACGGSTNLLLHIPGIAFDAGLRRPTVDDWSRIIRQVPRLVDVLPNGPVGHPTVRMYLAGGVPEVMLHLRTLSLLKLDVMTAACASRAARAKPNDILVVARMVIGVGDWPNFRRHASRLPRLCPCLAYFLAKFVNGRGRGVIFVVVVVFQATK